MVLELLYIAAPKPKSVLLGNDGVPDPAVKLLIRYVLLNLASEPGKLNVRPACVNVAQLANNALVFALSTLVIETVISPPVIVYELLVDVPKSIEEFWKP